MADFEDALRNLANQVKLETIETCAKLIEPKGPRPCDCEPFSCYCQNYGDAQTVASWDADMENANRIRSLLDIHEVPHTKEKA